MNCRFMRRERKNKIDKIKKNRHISLSYILNHLLENFMKQNTFLTLIIFVVLSLGTAQESKKGRGGSTYNITVVLSQILNYLGLVSDKTVLLRVSDKSWENQPMRKLMMISTQKKLIKLNSVFKETHSTPKTEFYASKFKF